MKVSDQAPLTDLVNSEPAIFQGMSASEAKVVIVVGLVVFFILGLFLFWTLGYWQLIVLCTVAGPLLLFWLVSAQLAVIKRGRPDGYYSQAIHLFLVRRNLTKPKFISHDGYWELGRTLPFGLGAPLEPSIKESLKQTPTQQDTHENH